MRKPRVLETDEQRAERLDREAQERVESEAAHDHAIDELIRKNIQLHGP